MRGGKETLTGRNTLDAATARETTDGGLGDALDVVAEDLAVAFCAAFAEAFAAFSACAGEMVRKCSFFGFGWVGEKEGKGESLGVGGGGGGGGGGRVGVRGENRSKMMWRGEVEVLLLGREETRCVMSQHRTQE